MSSTDRNILQGRFSSLYQQQQQKLFCDVVALVEKERFHIHSCVLAASSEKLNDFFSDQMKTNSDNGGCQLKEVVLDAFTPKIFKAFLAYFYTAHFNWDNVTESDLADILKAAEWCDFKEIVEKCKSRIEKLSTEEQAKPVKTSALTNYFPEVKVEVIENGDFVHQRPKIATIAEEVPTNNFKVSQEQSERDDRSDKEYVPTTDSESESNISTVICEFSSQDTDDDRLSNTPQNYKRQLKSKLKPQKVRIKRFKSANLLKSAQKTWSCAFCGLVFDRKNDQVKHVKKVHGERPFKCTYCEKGFKVISQLKAHELTHTSEKPELCLECGKTFRNEQSLVDHTRTHSNEKAFLCTECGKAFTQRQALYRHRKIHQGFRPYICELCAKSFMFKHNLTNHRPVHDKQSVIVCKLCKKTVGDKESAIDHFNESHLHLMIKDQS